MKQAVGALCGICYRRTYKVRSKMAEYSIQNLTVCEDNELGACCNECYGTYAYVLAKREAQKAHGLSLQLYR